MQLSGFRFSRAVRVFPIGTASQAFGEMIPCHGRPGLHWRSIIDARHCFRGKNQPGIQLGTTQDSNCHVALDSAFELPYLVFISSGVVVAFDRDKWLIYRVAQLTMRQCRPKRPLSSSSRNCDDPSAVLPKQKRLSLSCVLESRALVYQQGWSSRLFRAS